MIVSVWNYNLKTEERLTTYRGHFVQIWTIAISHTGMKVAAGGDSFWGFSRDLELKSQPWADDEFIVTCSEDGSVCLWDAHSGISRCLRIMEANEGAIEVAVFSPDLSHFITTYAPVGDDPRYLGLRGTRWVASSRCSILSTRRPSGCWRPPPTTGSKDGAKYRP